MQKHHEGGAIDRDYDDADGPHRKPGLCANTAVKISLIHCGDRQRISYTREEMIAQLTSEPKVQLNSVSGRVC